MYGEDRLTTPLLRKRDGKYAKDGDFTPVSWDEAFDIMEEKYKAALKTKGPTSIGMFESVLPKEAPGSDGPRAGRVPVASRQRFAQRRVARKHAERLRSCGEASRPARGDGRTDAPRLR